MMDDAQKWDEELASLPGAHLLQTWEWGTVKNRYGWQTFPQRWHDAGGKLVAAALVLQRPLMIGPINTGLSILYVPRGPVLQWSDPDLRKRVLSDLIQLARKKKAILIKIDPEVALAKGFPGSAEETADPTGIALQEEITKAGWVFSNEQVQFRNTVILDLQGNEEEWLARMKPKTRYNIRLAQKKDVRVRDGSKEDYAWLYRMYAETSLRDGFIIRPESYYRTVWETFQSGAMLDILVAEDGGEPVAALFLFHFAGKAWYLYGMSGNQSREKMPNYLLQWQAMIRAKDLGCFHYDLWGAPDIFDESDSMWGVFRFKEGLGGTVLRTPGAWDYPCRPAYYKLYTQILPRVLDVMRRRGKNQIRKEVLQ